MSADEMTGTAHDNDHWAANLPMILVHPGTVKQFHEV